MRASKCDGRSAHLCAEREIAGGYVGLIEREVLIDHARAAGNRQKFRFLLRALVRCDCC